MQPGIVYVIFLANGHINLGVAICDTHLCHLNLPVTNSRCWLFYLYSHCCFSGRSHLIASARQNQNRPNLNKLLPRPYSPVNIRLHQIKTSYNRFCGAFPGKDGQSIGSKCRFSTGLVRKHQKRVIRTDRGQNHNSIRPHYPYQPLLV